MLFRFRCNQAAALPDKQSHPDLVSRRSDRDRDRAEDLVVADIQDQVVRGRSVERHVVFRASIRIHTEMGRQMHPSVMEGHFALQKVVASVMEGHFALQKVVTSVMKGHFALQKVLASMRLRIRKRPGTSLDKYRRDGGADRDRDN